MRVIGEGFEGVLAAARAGAGWALTRLYEDLAPTVTGYLRSRGVAEPDDAASEVFLGVFRNLATFAGSEAQFRSWVFTIAHRRMLDTRRRAARRPSWSQLEERHDPAGGDVEGEALASLGDGRVRELLDTLSPDQREVILLRVVADLSVEQTAEVVGKSAGAVKQLQRRGLEALRRTVDAPPAEQGARPAPTAPTPTSPGVRPGDGSAARARP